MVEPLHPDLRTLLKQAHADLSDDDIDRLEELTSQRYALDPDRDVELLRQLDADRDKLLREKMPRYAEAYRAYRATQGREEERVVPGEAQFRVERREPE
jgi:hypothetical protein